MQHTLFFVTKVKKRSYGHPSILVFKISGIMFFVSVFTKTTISLKQSKAWRNTIVSAIGLTECMLIHTLRPLPGSYIDTRSHFLSNTRHTHTEHTARMLDFKAMCLANCVQSALWLWNIIVLSRPHSFPSKEYCSSIQRLYNPHIV